MDLRMPGVNGAAAIRELAERKIPSRVLVLTTYDSDSDVVPAIEAGATGYLLKDSPREELVRAVRAASRGESVLASSVATRLMSQLREPAQDALSDRELEVLSLIAQGRDQPRGGGATVHLRGDRQDAPAPHLREARRQRSCRGRRDRVRARSVAHRPDNLTASHPGSLRAGVQYLLVMAAAHRSSIRLPSTPCVPMSDSQASRGRHFKGDGDRASARSSSPRPSPSSSAWRSSSRTASPTSCAGARPSPRSTTSRPSSAATSTPSCSEASLDLEAPRDPAIDAQLERLTQSGEIRRINIWSRDGRIVYSNVAELRGRRFSIGPLLASAYAGDGVARYVDGEARRPRDRRRARRTACRRCPGGYLELFVPIRGAVDGNPIGVYDVYQDARLIEQRIDATRSGVFVVALVASSLLVALIWLAFGGASRVLAGQNRRLQEQATTERLLLVDLQRSEERFRSLVQNASDGVRRPRRGRPGPLREPGRRADPRSPRRGRHRPAGDRRRPSRRSVDRGPPAGRRRRLERLRGRGRVPGPPRRRLVANARGDRQEPARRPGGRRRRRQLPRHHRAEGARGAAPPPGVPRRPDRAGEPLALPRPPRPRPGAGRPRRPADRGPVPRPRRLQGRQRSARSRRGRSAARRRRRAAAGRDPSRRHRRPARRRRVRDHRRGDRAGRGRSRPPQRILEALAPPFDARRPRRSSPGPASASPSSRRTAAMPTSCCAAPTSRCTRPRRAAATATSPTRPSCTTRPSPGWS